MLAGGGALVRTAPPAGVSLLLCRRPPTPQGCFPVPGDRRAYEPVALNWRFLGKMKENMELLQTRG